MRSVVLYQVLCCVIVNELLLCKLHVFVFIMLMLLMLITVL